MFSSNIFIELLHNFCIRIGACGGGGEKKGMARDDKKVNQTFKFFDAYSEAYLYNLCFVTFLFLDHPTFSSMRMSKTIHMPTKRLKLLSYLSKQQT